MTEFDPKSLLRGPALLIAALVAPSAGAAAVFKQEWDAVEGAKEYEYQLANKPDFSDIEDKGTVANTAVRVNVDAGVYYFRLRAIGRGAAGAWTPGVRVLVSEERIVLTKPAANEKIPLLSAASELVVRWNSLGDRVDDYSLRLEGPDKKSIFLQSPRDEVAVPNLTPGPWKLQVSGRRKGNALFVSKPISIELLAGESFVPRITAPLDGEQIPEFSEFELKWIRKLPGRKSEVLLAKADQPGFPIVWRRNVAGATTVELSGIPRGRYQLTVKDFESGERESTEQTITLVVVDNRHDLQPESIGVTGRFVGGVFFGYRSISTPSMLGQSARSPWVGKDQFESRATWKYSAGWGLEAQLGSGRGSYQFPGGAAAFSGVNYDDPDNGATPLTGASVAAYNLPIDGFVRFGALRRYPLKNPRLDFWLKFLLHYRYFRGPAFNLRANQTTGTYDPVYSMVNYGQAGFAVSAELKWKLQPWTELCAEATLPLPLLAEAGRFTPRGRFELGTGRIAEFYFPEVRGELFLRRKVSREFRLLVGVVTQVGFTSVREKAMSGIFDQVPTGRRTKTVEFSVSPRIGFDWDL